MNIWKSLLRLFKGGSHGKKEEEKVLIQVKDEAYWSNKHPIIQQVYSGRPLPTGVRYDIDVRHFVWSQDITLNQIVESLRKPGMSMDTLAGEIQKWVVKNISYKADNRFGTNEYWLFPSETLALLSGDCEDGGILMASLLRCAGIPEWRVNCSAGVVQASPTAPQGGHLWVSYCRESDNEFVPLDWCYFEDSQIPVEKKPLQKTVSFYKQVWFNFNDIYARADEVRTLAGRIRRRI